MNKSTTILPAEVYGEGREGVKEEAGQFVKTVDNEAVVEGDCHWEKNSHTVDVVGLEPDSVPRKKICLQK